MRFLRLRPMPAFVAALLLALLGLRPLYAVEPNEMLADPKLEARARVISKELRCMVCQNESIDDSGAPLAHDLRVLVRERLKAGDSDTQIVDFLVARYGEFVLLRPRFEWRTALLWGFPPAILLGGILTLFIVIRRRNSASPQHPQNLTPAEESRLAELMREGN